MEIVRIGLMALSDNESGARQHQQTSFATGCRAEEGNRMITASLNDVKLLGPTGQDHRF